MRISAVHEPLFRGRFVEDRFSRSTLHTSATVSHASRSTSQVGMTDCNLDICVFNELVELIVSDLASASYTFSGFPASLITASDALSPEEIARIGCWLHDEIVADVVRRHSE